MCYLIRFAVSMESKDVPPKYVLSVNYENGGTSISVTCWLQTEENKDVSSNMDNVIGHLNADKSFDNYHICNVFVDVRHRRQGVATMMMNEICQAMDTLHASASLCCERDGFLESFYGKFGFARTKNELLVRPKSEHV